MYFLSEKNNVINGTVDTRMSQTSGSDHVLPSIRRLSQTKWLQIPGKSHLTSPLEYNTASLLIQNGVRQSSLRHGKNMRRKKEKTSSSVLVIHRVYQTSLLIRSAACVEGRYQSTFLCRQTDELQPVGARISKVNTIRECYSYLCSSIYKH